MSCCETVTGGERPVEDADARRRQTVVVLSSVGIANAITVSLRQLNVIGHLPDPPLENFHADAVTTSRQAYVFGFPDAPLAAASLAANIVLALAGGRNRAEQHPWLPVAAATKAVSEAGIAAWYFVQMPTRLHVWCIYCVAGATLSAAIASLTIPEARRAAVHVRRRVAIAVVAAAMVGVGVWMLGVNRGRDQRLEGREAERAA